MVEKGAGKNPPVISDTRTFSVDMEAELKQSLDEESSTAMRSYLATVSSGESVTNPERSLSPPPPQRKNTSGLFSLMFNNSGHHRRISSPLPIQSANAHPKELIIDVTSAELDELEGLTMARHKRRKRRRKLLVIVAFFLLAFIIIGAVVGIAIISLANESDQEEEFFCGSLEEDERIRNIISGFRVEDANDVPFLEFVDVDIDCLPADAFLEFEEFEELVNVSSLTFTRTGLNRISPEAFDFGDFGNLELLEFDSTDLSEILPDTLDPLYNLKSLSFENNAFRELEYESVFATLEKLEEINFAGNRFVALPIEVFTINSIVTVNFQNNILMTEAEDGINIDSQTPFLREINLANTPLGRDEDENFIRSLLRVFNLDVEIILSNSQSRENNVE